MIRILSVSLILLLLTFCATGPYVPPQGQLKGKTEHYLNGAWLDDNTLLIRGIGTTDPAKVGLARRLHSEEAALLQAQKRAVEFIVGARLRGSSGSESGEANRILIEKEYEGTIKRGSVARKIFNEFDDCERAYVIRDKGLKDKLGLKTGCVAEEGCTVFDQMEWENTAWSIDDFIRAQLPQTANYKRNPDRRASTSVLLSGPRLVMTTGASAQ